MKVEEKIDADNGVIYWWFTSAYNFASSKEEKRVLEHAEIHRALQKIDLSIQLSHSQNGAPVILGGKYNFISISHYKGWFALYLSNEKCGIDIQPYHKEIAKGSHYFINENEKEIAISEEILYLVWSAKEALYKMKEGNINDLKNDVTTVSIDNSNKKLMLKMENKIYPLHFQIAQKYVLVWTM